VPRTGGVNARRPGRWPGRSEAESIDAAEHGTTIKRAMVRVEFCSIGAAVFFFESRDASVPTCGAFICRNLCAQTWTCGTATDGVNDPVSAGWGHSPARTAGSFTPSFVQRLQHRHRH